MLLSQGKLTKIQGGIKSAEKYYLLLKGLGFLVTTLSHLIPFSHTLEYFKAKGQPQNLTMKPLCGDECHLSEIALELCNNLLSLEVLKTEFHPAKFCVNLISFSLSMPDLSEHKIKTVTLSSSCIAFRFY